MEIRLLEFVTGGRRSSSASALDDDDNTVFEIQMFGLTEAGESCSVLVEGFTPFFYCTCPYYWTDSDVNKFEEDLKWAVGPRYRDSILRCIMVRRYKLDGFDNNKEHKFIEVRCRGMPSFYRAQQLWYKTVNKERVLLPDGMRFKRGHDYHRLYEGNIPPLLRFFHIQNLSPSGWVRIEEFNVVTKKKTTCVHEVTASLTHVKPVEGKETMVPYKICSFDIEASSSHGDFPVPTKTYKRFAENVVDEFRTVTENHAELLADCVRTAFGFGNVPNIERVESKEEVTLEELNEMISKWLVAPLKEREEVVERGIVDPDEEDDGRAPPVRESNVVELMMGCRDVLALSRSMKGVFPELEGDTVTFIGSTFVKYGETEPYNHCIVKGGCAPVAGVEIQCCETEREVLLAWTALMHRENPDIVMGYNLFGFDEHFLFVRAKELDCEESFLKLGRNLESFAGIRDKEGAWVLPNKKVTLASGEFDLNFFKLEGRFHLDLYNVIRRDYAFESYKLDNVAAYFISDTVSSIVVGESVQVFTKNMHGLKCGNYIMFEETTHSSELCNNGKKYQVTSIEKDHFCFDPPCLYEMSGALVKWCLAKDEMDHHGIFRLAKGSDEDRALVAKYCVQDCNLVHHLLQKTDMITGFIEMAALCSVPMDYLVSRGQGIKLTSFISKKCRERFTLMPVLQTTEGEGYEGAIVLEPKCNVYVDDPVAVLDFKSLYPSSMIAENICSSSKVSTTCYKLERDETGKRIPMDDTEQPKNPYDESPGYMYRDIETDLYEWRRPTPKGKAVKVIIGTKVCRFAQPIDRTKKAIFPSVLAELLKARSVTRKLIPKEKDEFMRNILDKRQNAYKLTANSLYGQCGARTSTFFDQDVAASCTAVGRDMLGRAKAKVESFVHTDYDTSQGKVDVSAEYVYGDTDSVFFRFAIYKDKKRLIGKDALALTIELGQKVGEEFTDDKVGCPEPHELEYEKTFFPFILLAKKRYVGMKYENNPLKCVRVSMGIVLKRRGNAPIVKDVYGGMIDMIMHGESMDRIVEFVRTEFHKLMQGQVSMDKLIITKQLRSHYKRPASIAHKVLADRIGLRDVGNKPKGGDRISYLFVEPLGKKRKKSDKVLQGDCIETPEFAMAQGLRPDYEHYIENQLMVPVIQVLSLVKDTIPAYQHQRSDMDRALQGFKAKDDAALARKRVKLEENALMSMVR